jgi:hypothetical protein
MTSTQQKEQLEKENTILDLLSKEIKG